MKILPFQFLLVWSALALSQQYKPATPKKKNLEILRYESDLYDEIFINIQ